MWYTNSMGRGGKRAGAGRKPHTPPLRRISAYLTEEQIKLLRMWGRGDISAGLRWLISASASMIRRASD